MEILTSAEMGAVDRRRGEGFGVRGAGRLAKAERVGVLGGKGNNGGDGLVAARVLAEAGVDVDVVLLGRAAEVKGEAAGALVRLPAKVRVHEVADETALAE